MLEFRLLGTIEVGAPDAPIELGSGKQRALLSYFLLHRNRALSRDALIDALWGDDPPASAAHALDVYVSRLRKSLAAADGEGLLETHRGGYRFNVGDDAIDIARFERLLGEARQEEDAPARLAAAERALSLWRGEALTDVLDEPFARAESARLEEQRLLAEEERFEALLALGRHDEAIGPLAAFAAAAPLRERPRRQLMLALYRAGRQAEALEVYRDARRTLRDELGLEPSPELRELEAAVLRQDPALAAPARSEREAGRLPRGRARDRRRALLLVAAGVAVVAAVALLLLLLAGTGGGLAALRPESVGLVGSPSGRIELAVLSGSRPTAVATGFGSSWVANEGDDSVARIDPRSESIVQRIPVGAGPRSLAVAADAIWVVNSGDGTVSRIDPATNGVVQLVRVGNGPGAILAAAGSLWVANELDGTVSRIDPRSGKVVRRVSIAGRPSGLAFGAGSIWVTDSLSNEVVRIDPASGTPTEAVPVGAAPTAVAAAGGAIWVANVGDGTLSRVDPARGAVVGTVNLGSSPGALAGDGNVLWAAEPSSSTLVLLDARSGRIVRAVRTGSSPSGLAASGHDLWVTTLAPPSAHRGGTLRIERDFPNGPVDPAFIVNAADPMPTNDGLVAFDHSVGAQQGLLVPDLAQALPRPTGGDMTYVFRLRAGLHYSNGASVRASDARFAIERLYKLRPHASPYATTPSITGLGSLQLHLVGEAACAHRPRTCDLSSGISSDDAAGTVTFHLTAPDPNFLEKLTNPVFDLLPPTTPLRTNGVRPVAATGPYVVAANEPGRRLLIRNPRFREWSPAAQPDGYPDQIQLREVASDEREVSDVLGGRADWMQGFVPPGVVPSLRLRHANQLRVDPIPLTYFLFLNTRLAPFDNVSARRALAFAVDRGTVTRMLYTPLSARLTCQLLPPNFPAYAPYCPFTLDPNAGGEWTAPDAVTAQQLALASHTRGDRVDLYLPADRPFARPLGRYLTRLLDSLGWPASISYRPIDGFRPTDYWAYVGDSRHRVQAGWGAWSPDFYTPASYVADLLGCDAFKPSSTDNANDAEFCDRALQNEIDRAERLDATQRNSATALWTRIEHQLVDRAAIVPLAVPQTVTVVSRRLGNYSHPPDNPAVFDQFWVR